MCIVVHCLTSWSTMIEVGSLVCLCALHLTLKCNLGSLGYHAPRCIIDGPRTKGHASLSPIHDREHWPCLHMLKIPYHALLVCCCCQNCLLQEFSADRQYRVPTGTIWVADNIIDNRWLFYTAGGHPSQPMMFCNAHRRFSGTLTVFREEKAVKQRQQWHGADFPGESDSSMHHSRIPRRGCNLFYSAFKLLIKFEIFVIIYSVFGLYYLGLYILLVPPCEGTFVISVCEWCVCLPTSTSFSLLFTCLWW